MRSAGVYLLEVEVGQMRLEKPPKGEVLFTLRIGKSHAAVSVTPAIPNSNEYAAVLQLNVDSSALDTQRCSLSLHNNTETNKNVIGIALISLPKDKNSIANTYKLTQGEDKKAEIDLKISIRSLEAMKSSFPNGESKSKEEVKGEKEGSSSNIKILSNQSEEPLASNDQKRLRNYKVIDDDKVLEINEKEVKRLKAEKEAYYQMYQIEKSKNQVASRFISNVIRKLTDKYPDLAVMTVSLLSPPTTDLKKNKSQQSKSRNPSDIAAIEQLEQANRSLHRQVQDYKKIVEQLNQHIASHAAANQSDNVKSRIKKPAGGAGFLDFGPIKSPAKDKSNIIPAFLKENPEADKELRSAFSDIDLKKWLEISIGQRESLQPLFSSIPNLPEERPESKVILVKKIKTSIDKAFSQLLSGKELGRPAILSHKQQINRILDEFIAV